MLPAAPELSRAAFYIAAGNYRKNQNGKIPDKAGETDAHTESFIPCSVPCAAKMRQIHALFTKDG
ncbi:hypothetical protein [Faecalibacterium wellingii]|uniref:hypothetical protein n=1 Tax=Faecalibacterium wellingii TaxID=2929491 RepID=UPI0030D7603C